MGPRVRWAVEERLIQVRHVFVICDATRAIFGSGEETSAMSSSASFGRSPSLQAGDFAVPI